MAHASLPSLGELLLLSLLLLFGLGIKRKAVPALVTVSRKRPVVGPLSWVICGAELGAGCVEATGVVPSQQQLSRFCLDSTPVN